MQLFQQQYSYNRFSINFNKAKPEDTFSNRMYVRQEGQYLILDNNMIESINNFPSILSLHTLSICNNSLNNLNAFINAAITKFPRLRSLNTLTNPINPGMTNPQGYNQYKNYNI